jgi:hypothetical protein
MEKSGRQDVEHNEATSNGIVTKELTAGGTDPVLIQPTYKPLPDDDVNWQIRNNSTGEEKKEFVAEMGKQNGTDTELEDGAQECMLKDDVKLSVVPSKDPSEVS